MMDRDSEALAALYGLGLLEADEAKQLSDLAKANFATAGLLREYAEAARAIALSVEPVAPPASVKAALFDSISNDRAGFQAIDAKDEWRDHTIPGVKFKQLASDKSTVTLLFKLGPNTVFPSHFHRGQELCYVVEGSYLTAGRRFSAGDFVRAAPGTTDEEIRTQHGTTLLVVMAAEDYYAA